MKLPPSLPSEEDGDQRPEAVLAQLGEAIERWPEGDYVAAAIELHHNFGLASLRQGQHRKEVTATQTSVAMQLDQIRRRRRHAHSAAAEGLTKNVLAAWRYCVRDSRCGSPCKLPSSIDCNYGASAWTAIEAKLRS